MNNIESVFTNQTAVNVNDSVAQSIEQVIQSISRPLMISLLSTIAIILFSFIGGYFFSIYKNKCFVSKVTELYPITNDQYYTHCKEDVDNSSVDILIATCSAFLAQIRAAPIMAINIRYVNLEHSLMNSLNDIKCTSQLLKLFAVIYKHWELGGLLTSSMEKIINNLKFHMKSFNDGITNLNYVTKNRYKTVKSHVDTKEFEGYNDEAVFSLPSNVDSRQQKEVFLDQIYQMNKEMFIKEKRIKTLLQTNNEYGHALQIYWNQFLCHLSAIIKKDLQSMSAEKQLYMLHFFLKNPSLTKDDFLIDIEKISCDSSNVKFFIMFNYITTEHRNFNNALTPNNFAVQEENLDKLTVEFKTLNNLAIRLEEDFDKLKEFCTSIGITITNMPLALKKNNRFAGAGARVRWLHKSESARDVQTLDEYSQKLGDS